MKKETKRMLIVVFLALTMFFSSAAWIIVGAAPLNQQRQGGENQTPENFVVEGRMNESVADGFFQRGFSLMEWHSYVGCCPDLTAFAEGLPAELEYQLILQKISDSNQTWATVRSLRGEATWNVTQISELLGPLCDVLLKPPIDCGLMRFGNESANATNTTENETG